MADTQISVIIIDGTGVQRDADWMQDTYGNIIPQTVPRVNGAPVSWTNGMTIAEHSITPVAVSGSLVAGSSAVAQSLQQATSFPGMTVVICNPSTAAGQGISSTESIWVDFVTTAQNSGGSTSIEVLSGGILRVGPTTNTVSWIAATGGHRIGAYAYV
jgi:hypothetical protein